MRIALTTLRKPILSLAVACAALLSAPVQAAVPLTIAYQGALIDLATDEPLEATVAMTFSLYDSPAADAPLWSETHPAVEVQGGRFDVALGSQTPFGALEFDRQYFLGIQVGSDVMGDRLPFHAAPYALRAASVDNDAIGGEAIRDGSVNSDHIVSLDAAKLTGALPATAIPQAGVTQHQAALSLDASQIAGAKDATFIADFATAVNSQIDARRGAANGIASLDATGKVPAAQLPAVGSSSRVYQVASDAEQLALTVQEGDICVRTDTDETFVARNDANATLDDWLAVVVPLPPPPVSSVNGLTGAVDLSTSEVDEGTNLYYTDARADARIAGARGAADGIASLDATGRVPETELPERAFDTVFHAPDEAAQLALAVQEGDLCIRTDLGKTFVALNSDNTGIGDWQEILADTGGAGGGVSSVNGKTGTVALDSDEIPEGTTNRYYSDALVAANPDVGANTAHRNALAGNPHGVTAQDVGLENVLNVEQLDKSQNLADLPDTTAARGNLGLGALAAQDQVDDADITSLDAAKLSGAAPDGVIPESAVTQHQTALSIAGSQVVGPLADSAIPESGVTQHQTALAIDAAQVTGTKDATFISDLPTAVDGRIAAVRGAADGVASLDAAGRVPTAELPHEALVTVHNVADEADQLALTVEQGDICVRSDLGKTFVALNDGNASLADWQEIVAPAAVGGVTSVNGQTGVVNLTSSDVGLGNVFDVPQLNKNYNLGDLPDPALARGNLGLGTMATKNGVDDPDIASLDAGKLFGTAPDAVIPESAVTQHQTALSIAGSQVVGPLADSAIPESSVTQHQAALAIDAAQVTGTKDATFINDFSTAVTDQINARRSASDGVASLDATGRVPEAELPERAFDGVFYAATDADQFALMVQEGDLCIRTDLGKTYVALNSNNTGIADWQEILADTGGGAAVSSVNGQVGTVSLDTDDVPEGAGNRYYSDGLVSGSPDVLANSAHRTTVGGNPHGVTAFDVGLSNVLNVPQLDKNANLSDLSDLTAAHANLGLQDLAFKNTITGVDVTDGSILDADIGDLNASKLSGTLPDSVVPLSAVQQHETALNLDGSQIAAATVTPDRLTETYLRTDGASTVTGAIDMGGFALTNLAPPGNPQDAATREFVEMNLTGHPWKLSVRAATTGPVNLIGTDLDPARTIDGVLLAEGDRVLVKDQTDATENGIYVVKAAGGPMRAADADQDWEMLGGALLVREGTTNADSLWLNQEDDAIIGASAMTFTKVGGSGPTLIGGDGIDVTAGAGTQTATVVPADLAGDGLIVDGSGDLGVNAADGLMLAGDFLAVALQFGGGIEMQAGELKLASDVVRTDAVQELTNKTLTSPTIGGGSIDGALIGQTTRSSARVTALSANGPVTFESTATATAPAMGGALTVNGGMGVARDAFVGGKLHVTSTVDTADANTGALVVDGGAGIGMDLQVGGDTVTGGAMTVGGDITTTGGSVVTPYGKLPVLQQKTLAKLDPGERVLISHGPKADTTNSRIVQVYATETLFGDGSDGDLVVDGSTHWLSGGEQYSNVTVTATGILETNGYPLYVNDTLTVEAGGIIRDSNSGGMGGYGGPGGSSTGMSGASGNPGGAPVETGAGRGGNGGGGGGAGADETLDAYTSYGGAGGSGGEGGSGGGVVRIYARNLDNAGHIHANGTAGTTALDGTPGGVREEPTAGQDVCGGGGGGGAGGDGGDGGLVSITYRTLVANTGAIQAQGGLGGAGGNGGSADTCLYALPGGPGAPGGTGAGGAGSGGDGYRADGVGNAGSVGSAGADGNPGIVDMDPVTADAAVILVPSPEIRVELRSPTQLVIENATGSMGDPHTLENLLINILY